MVLSDSLTAEILEPFATFFRYWTVFEVVVASRVRMVGAVAARYDGGFEVSFNGKRAWTPFLKLH